METLPIDPISRLIATRQAEEASQASEPRTLGRDDFLQLLIAQLENQDPMQPAKDTEFVAQLSTFSSLEQLIDANDNLQSLAVGQDNLINSQALTLIGKDALVEVGDEISITNGSAERLVYALPKTAQSATLTIFGEDGNPVRAIELETTADGRVTLDWDGMDGAGEPLSDGTYRFEVQATDLDGEPMGIAMFKALPIDGVSFGAAGIVLVSGDREIPFEQILEIRAGQPQS
ncbi:MAG: hypothetical protein GY716_08560 [bacterium]|nr:hypothetical protein [bacterium]